MSQTETIVPTAAIAERWEATTPVTGDYARDCAELAREALSHVGFSRFEETPFEDVLACREGDLPVTVAVLPVLCFVKPLPVAWRRMPNGIRHDKVSHPRHRNPSRSRQAPPPMRAWRTRQDSPLNCTSLPWWTTLSITAAAIWSSPKTLPQRLNSRLVVKTTDCRS